MWKQNKVFTIPHWDIFLQELLYFIISHMPLITNVNVLLIITINNKYLFVFCFIKINSCLLNVREHCTIFSKWCEASNSSCILRNRIPICYTKREICSSNTHMVGLNIYLLFNTFWLILLQTDDLIYCRFNFIAYMHVIYVLKNAKWSGFRTGITGKC